MGVSHFSWWVLVFLSACFMSVLSEGVLAAMEKSKTDMTEFSPGRPSTASYLPRYIGEEERDPEWRVRGVVEKRKQVKARAKPYSRPHRDKERRGYKPTASNFRLGMMLAATEREARFPEVVHEPVQTMQTVRVSSLGVQRSNQPEKKVWRRKGRRKNIRLVGIMKHENSGEEGQSFVLPRDILNLHTMMYLRRGGWSEEDQFAFGRALLVVDETTPGLLLDEVRQVELDVKKLSRGMRSIFWFSEAVQAYNDDDNSLYKTCIAELGALAEGTLDKGEDIFSRQPGLHAQLLQNWLQIVHDPEQKEIQSLYDVIKKYKAAYEAYKTYPKEITLLHALAEVLVRSDREAFQIIRESEDFRNFGLYFPVSLAPPLPKIIYKHDRKDKIDYRGERRGWVEYDCLGDDPRDSCNEYGKYNGSGNDEWSMSGRPPAALLSEKLQDMSLERNESALEALSHHPSQKRSELKVPSANVGSGFVRDGVRRANVWVIE
ncbi:hypothetical protein [Sansalvadorimonas verongulae]|uniref:hypothetical protein n=1 Tax=Sansalvadorimonas verongulae TaxID=2172824 RepID=UPI0012BCC133|nr:hypothetical protein [Sansalvadorimonas verongulae]MTI14548.1 hypothetical protein [Sansalvadorimonas verongulae]